MPTEDYAIDPGGPKRLELSWSGWGYQDFTIKLDGSRVGPVIPGRDALLAGQRFSLPDGTSLAVQLTKNGLLVLRDGRLIPGLGRVQVLRAAGILIAIGVLSLLPGLIFVVAALIEFPTMLDPGIMALLTGAVFLGLGLLALRRMGWALRVALGLLGLALGALVVATVIGATATLSSDNPIVATGYLAIGALMAGGFLIFFLYHVVQGVRALRIEKETGG